MQKNELKEPLKDSEEFFSRYKINIKRWMGQIINLGIPEEYFEEYLVFIRNLAEKDRFRQPDLRAINSLLLSEFNIQNFLQKIEGKMRNSI